MIYRCCAWLLTETGVRDALQGARGASEGQVRMVLAAIGRPWVVQ